MVGLIHTVSWRCPVRFPQVLRVPSAEKLHGFTRDAPSPSRRQACSRPAQHRAFHHRPANLRRVAFRLLALHRMLAAFAETRAPARSVLRERDPVAGEGPRSTGSSFDGPDGAPLRFNPVIACGGVGFLGEVCEPSAAPAQRSGDPPPVRVLTMNHVTYYVSDLERVVARYQRLTDMGIVACHEAEGDLRTEGAEGAPNPRAASGHRAAASGAGRGIGTRNGSAARGPGGRRLRSGPGDGPGSGRPAPVLWATSAPCLDGGRLPRRGTRVRASPGAAAEAPSSPTPGEGHSGCTPGSCGSRLGPDSGRGASAGDEWPLPRSGVWGSFLA